MRMTFDYDYSGYLNKHKLTRAAEAWLAIGKPSSMPKDIYADNNRNFMKWIGAIGVVLSTWSALIGHANSSFETNQDYDLVDQIVLSTFGLGLLFLGTFITVHFLWAIGNERVSKFILHKHQISENKEYIECQTWHCSNKIEIIFWYFTVTIFRSKNFFSGF